MRCIDTLPDARALVVSDDRRRLGLVGSEPLLEGLWSVVAALHEWLARHIVCHVLLGRVEGGVVGAAGRWVDEAAGDTRDKEGVVDLKLNGVLKLLVLLLEHVVETLSLYHGARETVEDETIRMSAIVTLRPCVVRLEDSVPSLALRVILQFFPDHANDNLVADKSALFHDLLIL